MVKIKAVWVLAIAFALLVIADSLITWWAVNHGYTELNLFIAPIAHTWQLVVAKIVTSLMVSVSAIWMAERFTKIWHPTPIVLTFSFIPLVGFMAFVVISNLMLIWF